MSSPEPSFRSHNIRQAAQIVADAIVPELDRMTRNCYNCSHVDVPNDKCGMFNEKPPIKVIVSGCEHWDQEIPF